ncbi:MAG TPA: hypothetical protein PKL35_07125, partial [Methanoregulaceae archaeon]|nr:hypothetical protein [Methanoregulaceae archaeon]
MITMKIFPDIGLVSLIFIVLNAELTVMLTGAELVGVCEAGRLCSFSWDPGSVAELVITSGIWPGSAVIRSIAPPPGFSVHPEQAKKRITSALVTMSPRYNEKIVFPIRRNCDFRGIRVMKYHSKYRSILIS